MCNHFWSKTKKKVFTVKLLSRKFKSRPKWMCFIHVSGKILKF